jgi:hypothetical protein
MKKNKKAILLIELSILIICSMIFFVAVSDLLSNRNYAVTRLIENNSVLMVFDSITDKIKFDLKSGIKPHEINFSKYKGMIKSDLCKLKFRVDKDKIDILLGIYYKEQNGYISIPRIKRIYKKEVPFYE